MPNKVTTKKELAIQNKAEQEALIEAYHNASLLISRAALASRAGYMFNGLRDLNAVFGYPVEITFDMFLQMYERDGLAARAVDGTANESWRKPPILWDGEVEGTRERGVDLGKQTDFLRGFNDLNERLHLFSVLNQADRVLGYSRYAVIFLGAPGNLSEPLKTGKIKYIEVLDEGEAQVAMKDTNRSSERFALPVSYNINFNESDNAQAVHFSRVIHIREGKERNSRYFGTPRLRKVFNYLMDLEKVMGGSSEAFWLLVRKGMALIGREGVDMPQKGTPAYDDLKAEIEEYEHGLRRFMRLRGMDVQDLGGQTVDGSGQADLLISAIAGTIEMPQRILMGSERGELASQQDDANWADVISARQTNFCDPFMTKPFINRLIEIGALPQPTDKWTTEYPSLFELNPLEKAQLANQEATAIMEISANAPETVADIDAFMEKNFPTYRMKPAAIKKQADRMKELRALDQGTPPEPGQPGLGKKTPEAGATFSQNVDDLPFQGNGGARVGSFEETDHPRNPKGSERGGEFAPKDKNRVWTGSQVDGVTKVSKLEAGSRGEKIAAKVLSQEFDAEFTTLNVGVSNAPLDLAGDHMAAEVKTGLATNSSTAQRWRATIGQPGKHESALLKKMSTEEKFNWNQRKSQLILKRKSEFLKKLSKEAGRKMKPMTVGVILSPDGKRGDVFFIPGFHLSLMWSQYATEQYYVGTFNA